MVVTVPFKGTSLSNALIVTRPETRGVEVDGNSEDRAARGGHTPPKVHEH